MKKLTQDEIEVLAINAIINRNIDKPIITVMGELYIQGFLAAQERQTDWVSDEQYDWTDIQRAYLLGIIGRNLTLQEFSTEMNDLQHFNKMEGLKTFLKHCKDNPLTDIPLTK